MINCRGEHWPQVYICILLYMKLIQCSGVAQIYGHLEEAEGGVCLPWVYVHSAIYENYSVQWCCLDLWFIGGGGYIYLRYMCILLYVKLIWCGGVAQIYGPLEEVEGGVSLPWVYVHSAMCETVAVQWFYKDL